MSVKVLAGFAAALVVTTVGVFAAGGGSMFDSSSPCGSNATCPLSAMLGGSKGSCCEGGDAAAATPVSCANPDALGACAGGGLTAAAPEAAPLSHDKCCADE